MTRPIANQALLHYTIEDTKGHLHRGGPNCSAVTWPSWWTVSPADHLRTVQSAESKQAREFPQAPHGDVQGPAGHPRQAGRPAPHTCAPSATCRPRSRPRRRMRTMDHLRAAGRPHGHAVGCAKELEDLSFRGCSKPPRRAPSIMRRFLTLQEGNRRTSIPRITRGYRGGDWSRGMASKGRRLRSRQKKSRFPDLAQDARKRKTLRFPRLSRHLTAFSRADRGPERMDC